MQRYLFVMTRDIISHPSAIYILRIALGLKHPVSSAPGRMRSPRC